MPITDYLNTSNYTSAKALFDEQARVVTGLLPRMTFWQTRDDIGAKNGWTTGTVTAAAKRRAVLDSGFYIPHFSDNSAQSTSNCLITGYTHLPAYVASTGIDYIIRAGRSNITHYNGIGTPSGIHPCYNTSGDHIGTETPGVVDPCGIGVANHTYSKQYRFFTAVDTPQNPMSDLGEVWAIPVIPESRGYWTSCDDYIYNNNGTYGKSIITTLQSTYSVPHNPIGITTDWEDWEISWRAVSTTLRNLYCNDPRFNFSSRTAKSSDQYWQEELCSMIHDRAAIIDTNLPYLNTDYSIIYDLNPTAARFGPYNNKLTKFSNGRKKGNLTAYPFYYSSGIFNDPKEVLLSVGRNINNFAATNIHNFQSWACSTISYPTIGGTFPDVVGTAAANEGILTVAQTVGWARFLFFSGTIIFIIYNDNNGSQDFWSFAVAYDEMQDYYDFIKEGINYIPPSKINRKWTDGNGNKIGYVNTCFYDLDYYNNTISSDIFISCRILNNKMLFFGYTLNTTGNSSTITTVDIRSPSNEKVTVSCTPWGSLTLL
jgi:hypothetical protein